MSDQEATLLTQEDLAGIEADVKKEESRTRANASNDNPAPAAAETLKDEQKTAPKSIIAAIFQAIINMLIGKDVTAEKETTTQTTGRAKVVTEEAPVSTIKFDGITNPRQDWVESVTAARTNETGQQKVR